MSKKNELEAALTTAMRNKDAPRKSTLRLALSAIKLAEVEKGEELDDAAILGVLQKEVKSRRESIADAEKAKRPELVSEAQAEIAILEEFLPKPLSAEELENLVKEAIAEVEANSPGDMGKVMKAIMPRVQGRADGGQVSSLVKNLLKTD